MDMPLAKQAESNPGEVEFAYVDAIPLLELEAVRFYQTCFYCPIPAPFILDGRVVEGLTSLYYRQHDRHVAFRQLRQQRNSAARPCYRENDGLTALTYAGGLVIRVL